MKNLQTLKKFAAIVVSAMMILSTFAVSSFADLDTATKMKITGINPGDTVTAYKVVGQDTGEGASNQWKLLSPYGDTNAAGQYVVTGRTEAYNFKTPDAGDINALAEIARASGTADTTNEFTYDEDEEAFISTGKEVGTWIVLVTPAEAGTIYNPIVVSRDYESTGSVAVLTGHTATAKKSGIHFEKVVERDNSNGRVNTGTNANNPSTEKDEALVDADAVGGNDGNRGDTAAYNEKVNFRINTTIPYYADNYFNSTLEDTTNPKFVNPKFNVYDELDSGLTFNQDVKVYELGEDGELAKTKDGKTLYEVKYDVVDKAFKLEFKPAGVKEYRGKNIEIRYTATVNDSHGCNFDGTKNEAYPEYSNKPGEDTVVEGPHKKTYHYTFTINGRINGGTSEYNREVIKIGKDKDNNFVYQESKTYSQTNWTPLTGVKFKLYKAEVDDDNNFVTASNGKSPVAGAPVDREVVSQNGILEGMTQLDAGKYVIVEHDLGPNTQYAKNTTPIAIDIQAVLDDQGRLKSYKVLAGDNVNNLITVGDYKKNYSGDEEGLAANGTLVTNITDENGVVDETKERTVVYGEDSWTDTDEEAADIINTPVGTLPSTGGMGTVLFTVGGIAIMALAIFLLFGGKKKQEQK